MCEESTIILWIHLGESLGSNTSPISVNSLNRILSKSIASLEGSRHGMATRRRSESIVGSKDWKDVELRELPHACGSKREVLKWNSPS